MIIHTFGFLIVFKNFRMSVSRRVHTGFPLALIGQKPLDEGE